MKKEKLYRCMGCNFINGYDSKFCGELHSMNEWLKILYPNKLEIAKNFFEGMKDKEIIDYLYRNTGKRLQLERR